MTKIQTSRDNRYKVIVNDNFDFRLTIVDFRLDALKKGMRFDIFLNAVLRKDRKENSQRGMQRIL